MRAVKIDQILASVLQRRMASIAKEMGLTLLRTTRSPLFNESRDFATGLYDAKGRPMEQTQYIPLLGFALHPVLKHVIDYFGDNIYPGDVIFHNDVYSGGNQNQDVAVLMPIFFDGQLVAWSACKGHQADIGGAVAGGYNPQAREIWQETFRITPIKVYEKGILRKDVWDLIFANVRFPVVEEDIRAQMGACVVGERRLREILEAYGLETFEAHVDYLFDATEKMMRREIENIPDGVYHGESIAYYDGINDGSKFSIRVAVTVKGDNITFDFTGTDPQTAGFVNAPLGSSSSAVLMTIMMLVDPSMPLNDGMLRPVNIIIPEGTILNSRFPAACNFGNHLSDEISEAIFSSLAKALPNRVTAAWNRKFGGVLTGIDPRTKRPYADIMILGSKGGGGATYGVNGYDHIGLICCGGAVIAQDYEMFEIQDPHFLLKHEYLPDSAGAGQWRGGLGVETVFRVYGEKVTASLYGDGIDEGPFGLFGGKPGALNKVEFTLPDGSIRVAKTKEVISPIPTGSIYTEYAGGGGGFGDPLLRPAEKVWDDVRNGLVSVEKARKDYGVVVDPVTLALDIEETEKERSKR